MGVTQRRSHIGMTEQPGDDRNRHAVHHRVAGMGVAEIVKANVLEARLAPGAVPERKISAAGPGGISRGRKDERASAARPAFENAPGRGIEGTAYAHGSGRESLPPDVEVEVRAGERVECSPYVPTDGATT